MEEKDKQFCSDTYHVCNIVIVKDFKPRNVVIFFYIYFRPFCKTKTLVNLFSILFISDLGGCKRKEPKVTENDNSFEKVMEVLQFLQRVIKDIL